MVVGRVRDLPIGRWCVRPPVRRWRQVVAAIQFNWCVLLKSIITFRIFDAGVVSPKCRLRWRRSSATNR